MKPPLLIVFLLSAMFSVALCHINVTIANYTAVDLALEIAGRGVTVTDAKFADCGPDQEGIFTNGELDIKFDNGIVLSSAVVTEVMGVNDNLYPTGDVMNHVGSNLLDQVLSNGRLTKDACTLHVNFDCADPASFGFSFVFGSDNYPSNGTKPYEDVMGVFLNDVTPKGNVGLYNGTYVSVDTLYSGPMYKNNSQNTYDCEMNGFTFPIKVNNSQNLTKPRNNEIWFAVADGYDPHLKHPGAYKKGAWLFVRRHSLRCANETVANAWKMSPKLCARQSVRSCGCRNWSCVDAYIASRCVRGGTKAERNDKKSQVHARIKGRVCKGL